MLIFNKKFQNTTKFWAYFGAIFPKILKIRILPRLTSTAYGGLF